MKRMIAIGVLCILLTSLTACKKEEAAIEAEKGGWVDYSYFFDQDPEKAAEEMEKMGMKVADPTDAEYQEYHKQETIDGIDCDLWIVIRDEHSAYGRTYTTCGDSDKDLENAVKFFNYALEELGQPIGYDSTKPCMLEPCDSWEEFAAMIKEEYGPLWVQGVNQDHEGNYYETIVHFWWIDDPYGYFEIMDYRDQGIDKVEFKYIRRNFDLTNTGH